MVENRESITAKLCLFARAYHSNYERPKIFDDYLAYDIMGHEEYEGMGQLIQHDFNLELFNKSNYFCKSKIRSKLNELISPIPLSRAAFESLIAELEKENMVMHLLLGWQPLQQHYFYLKRVIKS